MDTKGAKLKELFELNDKGLQAADAVYLTLKEAITSSLFEDGSRLNPHILADIFSVSRTPVKEALIRLMSEELIKGHKGNTSGYFVCALSLDESRSLMQFLQGLYSCATSLAHKSLDQYHVSIMQNKLKELSSCTNIKEYLALIRAYYFQLAYATRNSELIRAMQTGINKTTLMKLHYEQNVEATNFMREQSQMEQRVLDLIISGKREDLIAYMDYRNAYIAHYMFTHSFKY
ncbi:GntR family transcriptional regulator [Desulfovibrio sp. OttesenSCG-928-C14]|nr:GntR family transcriptional regulator [Desulfovibrio sp. OttesenSCG-928-C14]